MLRSLLFTISQIISIYSFLCIIRILLSWIPSAAYSPFGQFLSSLCDPYLNWFRRFPFTRIGMIDFSPILALGTLSVLSEIFLTVIRNRELSLWAIFIALVMMVWSFFSFIINLLLIALIIRLLYDVFGSSTNGSSFWYSLDRFLNPVISKATGFLSAKSAQYRTRLILTIAVLILCRILLGVFFGSLPYRFHIFNMI